MSSPVSGIESRRPLELFAANSPGIESAIDIPPDGLVVGRDPDCDLPLDGGRFPYLSARHVRFQWLGNDLFVEDLDSKNGTLVNGRAVTRQALVSGDVVQLGSEVGARFRIVSGAPLERTRTLVLGRNRYPLDPEEAEPRPLPDAARRGRGSRRHPTPLTFSLFALLLAAGIGATIWQQRRQREGLDEVRRLQEALGRTLDERLSATQERVATQERAYASAREAIAAQRDALLARIDEGRGDLAQLREQLAESNRRLDRFEPIDLAAIERQHRERLTRVVAAVVYIEKRVVLREDGGERYLHVMEKDGSHLRARPGDDDELFSDGVESGSGFIIDEHGHIVTNAHVVAPPEATAPIVLEEVKLVPEALLTVIFTNSSTRRPARLVRTAGSVGADVALLSITPFEGMPFIEGFSTERELPAPGEQVNLFGFPLGTQLLQEADLLKASIFRGMVSRHVDEYIQVQSAVYPGNSGGPLVDENGRVIGIVTAVQTVPGGQIASDIGYALPIRTLARIWP